MDRLALEAQLLGIDPDELRVLALLPLVHVAWADGKIQPAERALILERATSRYHLEPDARVVLETWLTYPPSRSYVQRGRRLMAQLIDAGRLAFALDADHPFDAMLGDAEAVAKAAGGWFGFRAIDVDEQRALEELGRAFADARAGAPAPEPPPEDEEPDPDDEVTQPIPPDVALPPRGAGAVAPPAVDGPALVTTDPSRPRSWPLSGGELTVGRHGDNDVVVATDARVSRHHARIRELGGHVYVEDLDSTNGLYVDGERVAVRRLFGGETLVVGSTRFTWHGGR